MPTRTKTGYTAAARVLAVDGDTRTLHRLKTHFEKEGFRVETARDGATGLAAARTGAPDLVILALALPPGDGDEPVDGLDVLRELRARGDTPVLVLSKAAVTAVKVLAFQLGADDYVTKPFDTEEVIERVRAILRRCRRATGAEGALRSGRVSIEPESRRVWKDGRPVELTALEFDVLHTLMRRPGRVFSREQLIDLVWKHPFFGVAKVVDVHIGHLRRKLEDDPRRPDMIVTVRGAGYRFEESRA